MAEAKLESTSEMKRSPSTKRSLALILFVLSTLALSSPSPAEPLTPFSRDQNLLPDFQPERVSQLPMETVPPEPLPPEEEILEVLPDPLEPMNRIFFQVNDRLYFWVFKPVASGYKAVLPQDLRVGVRNFFSNLTTPVRLVNCLLQGRWKASASEAARFSLNTTFGLAGFLDPAKKEFGIEKKDEDLGLTLGSWGMRPVFYITLPVIGPSSLRDALGFVGDIFLDPRTYLISNFWTDAGLWSYEKINETSLTFGEYEELKRAALDPYISLREAYHQYRLNKLKDR
jgi:phospholipid-binding lipoprotein MlaA